MKAKDTVIKITKPIVDEYSYTESYEVGDLDNPITIREKEWDLNGLLKAQAEISFKAGIREVVEAMFNESYGDPRVTGYYKINYDEWQAKLKEWEMNNE